MLCFYAAYAGESMIGPVEKLRANLLFVTVAVSGVSPVQLYIQLKGRETRMAIERGMSQ